MWKLTAAQKDSVVERYIAGESSLAIGKDLGLDSKSVRGIIHRRGVTLRTNRESHTRLPLNHAAFDVLTPEAAYWCGFIAADGTIVRRSGTPEVAIVLAAKDRGHLEKFRDFLGSGHAITDVAGRSELTGPTSLVRFSIRSQGIADRLTDLGVKRGPLAPELAASRDFWRGVVDGDGTVSAAGRKPRLEVVGHPYLLDQFVEFLAEHGVVGPTVRPSKTISRVQCLSLSATRTADVLWRGCTVSLDRKHEEALGVAASEPRLSARGEVHGNSRLTEADVRQIRSMYAEGGVSHRQLGATFGVAHSVIGKIVRGEAWMSV